MGATLSALLGGATAAEEGYSSSSTPSRVVAFHSSARWQLHFNDSKDSSRLLVVDFTASWCGPCKLMAPLFEGMSVRFTDVDFAKIDVDELSDVAQEFGVQAMPSFVMLKRGKEVDRVVGAKKDELERKVLKHRAV